MPPDSRYRTRDRSIMPQVRGCAAQGKRAAWRRAGAFQVGTDQDSIDRGPSEPACPFPRPRVVSAGQRLGSERQSPGVVTERPRGGARQMSSRAVGVVVLCGEGFFAFLHGLAQEVFDLPVDAAQLIRRPGFEFAPKLGIDPEQKGFSVCGFHGESAAQPPGPETGNGHKRKPDKRLRLGQLCSSCPRWRGGFHGPGTAVGVEPARRRGNSTGR